MKSSVRDRIDRESDVRVSAISLLEIATAVSLGRLVLKPSPGYWLDIAQSAEPIRIEPLTAELCLESTSLPGSFHRDPADRLIVALARQLDVELITADHEILAYRSVKTVSAS